MYGAAATKPAYYDMAAEPFSQSVGFVGVRRLIPNTAVGTGRRRARSLALMLDARRAGADKPPPVTYAPYRIK
jgi:hypothetical protein